MKVFLCILLVTYLLTGCEPHNSENISSERIQAPFDNQKEPLSDEKGPLEDLLTGYDSFDLKKVNLTELPVEIRDNPNHWKQGINLIASIPDADIALYAPLSAQELNGVLIRYGEHIEKFDWVLSRGLIQVDWGDYDGDGENELAVGNCTSTGMQIYHEDLHVIEISSDGQMKDSKMPDRLYREDLTHRLTCEMNADKNQISIQIDDRALVIFAPEQKIPQIRQDSDGIEPIFDTARYYFDNNKIVGVYGVFIACKAWGPKEFAAEIRAAITYSESEFLLSPTRLSVPLS